MDLEMASFLTERGRPDEELHHETAEDERQRFSYNVSINGALRMLKKQFEESGIEVDTRYMDYFGDMCPRCGGRIRAIRGVIDDEEQKKKKEWEILRWIHNRSD
jgi:hypothetical protein